MDVTEEELARFARGEHVQHVWPHLSAEDREFILSGITAEEWNTAFPKEDEDDDTDTSLYL